MNATATQIERGDRFLTGLRRKDGLRTLSSWLIVLLALPTLLSASTFGDLIVTGAFRDVKAGSTGGPLVTDSTAASGHYLKDATSLGTGLAGVISSFSHHDSTIPGLTGPSMSGAGSAIVLAAPASGLTGFSNIAWSTFDVDFEVTTTGFYFLDAEVDFTGDVPPYSGYAEVKLEDLTGSSTIVSIKSDPGATGMHSISSSYFLTAGIDYKLFAKVELAGGSGAAGSYGASGSWTVSLTPEPSSFILCCSGLVLGGLIRQRPKRE